MLARIRVDIFIHFECGKTGTYSFGKVVIGSLLRAEMLNATKVQKERSKINNEANNYNFWNVFEVCVSDFSLLLWNSI